MEPIGRSGRMGSVVRRIPAYKPKMVGPSVKEFEAKNGKKFPLNRVRDGNLAPAK
jgi:hypothetical protein